MIVTEHTQDIRAAQPTVAVLGYAVFWRLSGVQIPHAELVMALTQAGFGSYVPALPQPTTALRRALLTFIHLYVQETVLLRTVSQAPWVLALMREEPDQQGSLTYVTKLRVGYDPATQDMYCTRQPSGPIDATSEDPRITAIARALFQEALQTHTGEDLSRVLRIIIASLHAVRLQRGVYFVPSGESASLHRLDTLVAQLPGAPLLATLARLDERRTRERLVHAIHGDLMCELDGIEAHLTQLQTAHPQPAGKALYQHLARFQAVRNKAQVYTELLGTRLQEITARLEGLQASVQQLVLIEVNDLLPTAG